VPVDEISSVARAEVMKKRCILLLESSDALGLRFPAVGEAIKANLESLHVSEMLLGERQ
jgi:hypothetical protein